MTISDFDGARFWPAIRVFVSDAGVEPISLGEPEDESWPKIFAAMAARGASLSLGQTQGEILRALQPAVAEGADIISNIIMLNGHPIRAGSQFVTLSKVS